MLRCVAHVPICKGPMLTNPSLRKFDWAIQQTSTPLKPLVYNNKWFYFEFFDRSYHDWESASGKWSTCPKRKACRVKTCSPVSKLKPRTQRSPDPSETFVRKSFFSQNPEICLCPKKAWRRNPALCWSQDHGPVHTVTSCVYDRCLSVSTTGLGQVKILWMPKSCIAKATKTWQLHEAKAYIQGHVDTSEDLK